MNWKKHILLAIIFIMLCVLILSFHWRAKAMIYQKVYDFKSAQKEIKTVKGINTVLKQFEKLPFSKLDETYKKYTKSTEPKYEKLLKHSNYYIVYRKDFFKYIVGDIRVNDLIPKDKYYKSSIHNRNQKFYWLIDKKLLYKLLELQQTLAKMKYDPKAFRITNGFRHPRYNEEVGGAGSSRHIKGEAIDMVIKDIDKNGYYEKKDKDIVLELLDKRIIKSEGGIGRYPKSRTVHFDVRGTRARWDNY